jgi:hypothetical protein
MKDLGQAMAAFGKALEIDPNCQVKIEKIVLQINDFFYSGSYRRLSTMFS